MNTESTLTYSIENFIYTVDTGTNFGCIPVAGKSELHAFKRFVTLYGNHFNETLTIERKRPKLTDLSGFRNIFNP